MYDGLSGGVATPGPDSRSRLRVRNAGEHGLQIDDRGPVDGLDGSHPEPVPGDFHDPNAMQPERVWSIGRARREYPGEGKALVPSRV